MHEHIPLSKAMGVEVVEATGARVTLSAPLAPNINHRETVFGGSASAVALLSAWALLYLRLKHAGFDSRVVVQRNTMSYDRPIRGDFTATATVADADWRKFIDMLKRKGRARIAAGATVYCNEETVGRLDGEFVAAASTRPA
jgi:thioesterase domain-containing protein